MLKATIELEQKDVNPDDNLEPKLRSPADSLSPQSFASTATFNRKPSSSSSSNSSSSPKSEKLPLGAINSTNQTQPQTQEQVPYIKLKRFWNKENGGSYEEEGIIGLGHKRERLGREPSTKRSRFRELLSLRIRTFQEEESKKQQRKRKFCLSLVNPDKFKENKRQKKIDSEQPIECSPPVFSEEENESPPALKSSSRESNELSVGLGEIFAEEEVVQTDQIQPLLFSLFAEKTNKCSPRTYPGCFNSSSRLSLSKSFHQRVETENRVRSEVFQRPQAKAQQCAKVERSAGEDDMSIHHQQHYHLPCTASVNSNTASYPEVASSTTSILLLAAAAEESGKMSSHAHYTRSKMNAMQGRFSINSGTDMAVATSMGELPRSKVSSFQGRVDTGTATELAIAQSLSEEQQNNILAASTATAAPSAVVVNLNSPATSASIVAAANMNNSLATLCNIGNSCYLNSVLYTLRFAPNFIHNLHHLIEDTDSVYQRLSQNKLKSSSLGRNIPGLHGASGRSWSSKDLVSLGISSSGATSGTGNFSSSNNQQQQQQQVSAVNGTTGLPSATAVAARGEENLPPKSNRQVVTEQLHELFQNLHRNEAIEAVEPFHAGNILRAVQDVSATFEGNQQQDAHEFLMCVLDSVRESCQALIKTITDHPDVLINACPPVSESIETFVPETKSSRTGLFFRRRKESVKTVKPVNGGLSGGGATLPKATSNIMTGGGDSPATVAAEQVANNLKNALFAKPFAALDAELVRERVQALGLDFFRDDFEGVTVSKTKCLACETCTEQKETMIDIAIPIAASEVSDAAKNPQLFYQNSCITREYFRGDNKYRCEVCCGYREAIRSISFEILPRQLILQLKRFNGDMEKINSYIPTPFMLRCFCNTCLQKPDCDKAHIYRLYSVITHVGARMSVGHYIAYTSSLDVHAEFLGCGKDRRRQLFLSGGSIDGAMGPSSAGALGGATTGGKSGNEKTTSGHLKKLFSSKKASSAGDMSKKIKNNVVSKLNLINGIESLGLNNGTAASGTIGSSNAAPFGSQPGSNSSSSNGTPTSALPNPIPCGGLNCCGIHLKNSHLNLYGHNSSNSSSTVNANSGGSEGGGLTAINGTLLDGGSAGDIHTNCINSSSLLTTVSGSGLSTTTTAVAFEQSLSQQLWHMCDDDKIKVMSQADFEELLSPNRRHVITPYLLFYARYDLVPRDPAAATTDGSGETNLSKIATSDCCTSSVDLD
ncbi:uncharacterized protein LOC129718504 [Wyeomyia smithii]|uniref:uncharacterized protein LOC129718504 n=1 Tax=Wyeomyia smithii TaxID=174621 RepID=UPI002467E4E3|nr:uncharacterized protein LOC129718504 [Wyeomyia smithii]XP_055525303.1 uncharacterized protein LOC129718504 [Wyeomyia smithii]XP_055525312.1 uncharacterized protein LOC129718504 [Wyeomyia smithii]